MAKQSGLGDQLYIGGVNLSGDVGELGRIGGGPATLDVTGIDKSAMERIGGKIDGGIDFSAFFDDAPAQSHPTLKTLPTSQVIASYLRGSGIGRPGACCVARQVNYDPNRGADGALTFAVSLVSDGTGVQWGEQATPGIRSDTGPTNGASLDGGAASTFGFAAYLHVFSVTGTSVTVALQESSDNGVGDAFAAITGGAFAAVTPAGTPQAQRIAATPANLERYVRVVTTGTFTQASFAVVLVRHQVATVL